jgi:hypothetical protein
MKTSIKTIFESNNWVITSVLQGRNGIVRIDAKTRNRIADGENHFSAWCSEKYANRLAADFYSKKVSDFSCYRY